MLLAIDPGLATLGYAIVDSNGAVHELGVLLSESNAKKLGKQVDRVLRLEQQAAALATVIDRWSEYMTAIVAESLSFNVRRHTQVVSLCLSWGVIVGLARSRGLAVRQIQPKVWQAAVAPSAITDKAIDYDVVFRELAAYVGEQCRAQLFAIAGRARNHALDAVGVGVFAAMRPEVEPARKRRRA